MTANGVLDLWRGTEEEFQRRDMAGSCGRAHDSALEIESAIKVVYRVTAMEARNTDEMGEISRLWGAMAEICQDAVRKIATIIKEQPDCGLTVYVDRILDLAAKCQRLQRMHQPE